MAALDDLISQIPDESLRERIRAEVKRANRQKKFGLVFEEHLPEATPLYDIPVKRGSVVAKKDGQVTDIYYVEKIEDGQANCFHKATKERVVLPVDVLVCVAQFGEPIYPYLQPLDTVCNAPDSDLWHTLIEADNYHALQLLEYLYAGKVDCIYIVILTPLLLSILSSENAQRFNQSKTYFTLDLLIGWHSALLRVSRP